VRKTRKFSWINPKVECRNSCIKGRGVFARARIRKGEVVSVSGGFIVPEAEYNRLWKVKPAFIRQYAIPIAEGFYLMSGEREGELETDDFYNHSCTPNCGFRGQIMIVAMREIRAGEELTYDYAMTDSDPRLRMRCNCQSRDCRGLVTGNDWKIPRLQRKYRDYLSWHIREKIRRLRARAAPAC
jgi:SET domain-containing protein